MFLYEEYAKRFCINNPIYKRFDNSIVYLESSNIITINKKLNFNQPYSYYVSICKPNKEFDNSFFKVIARDEVEWQEYDNYLENLINKLDRCIADPNKVFCRSWEIFFSYNEKYFIDNFSYKVLYPTINENNANRMEYINDFILNNKILHSDWLKMKKNIENYSYWLAELINNKS